MATSQIDERLLDAVLFSKYFRPNKAAPFDLSGKKVSEGEEESCAGLLLHYLRLGTEKGRVVFAYAIEEMDASARSQILAHFAPDQLEAAKNISSELKNLIEAIEIIPIKKSPIGNTLRVRLAIASGMFQINGQEGRVINFFK